MDKNLINKIRKGDEEAFELLFKKYYVRLCGFARKFTINTEEAEEIVQEVFLKIWEKRELLKSEKEIKPYLFMSVQNLCFNLLEHKKVEDKYYSVIEFVYKNSDRKEFDAFEELLGTELQERVKKVTDSLPAECQRIFLMSRNEGLKYAEIAERLEISIKTVETQMSRALAKFRKELKDYLTILILGVLIAL